MFAAVDVRGLLAGQVADRVVDLLVDVAVLFAFEFVKKHAGKTLVEIGGYAMDNLFEDIEFCGAFGAVLALDLHVLVHDVADGDFGGEGDHLEVFGDVFPVVDKDTFERIGHWDWWDLVFRHV